MKKKLSFLVIICSVIFVLSACSSSATVSFDSNWNKDTSIRKISSSINEKMTYTVSYTEPENPSSDLKIESMTGTYTTQLTSVIPEGKEEYYYKLDTRLDVAVKYNDSDEVYNDWTETSCIFSNIDRALYPLQSERKVYSHTPTTKSSKTVMNYSVKTTYEDGNANVISVDNGVDHPTEEYATIKDITKLGYYTFDNEQLIFALRGFNLEEQNFQLNLSIVDSLGGDRKTMYLSTKESVEKEYSNINWNNERTFDNEKITTNVAQLSYSSTMKGTTKEYHIAKKISNEFNTYRNVLLKIVSPMAYNLGTINYDLTEYIFSV